MTKLQVLCLHGFGTNGKFMQKQCQSFTRNFSDTMDFHFVDGPFEAPTGFVIDQRVIDLIEGSHRCWFRFHSQLASRKPFNQGQDPSEELKMIRDAIQKPGVKYNAIMGFSQGSVLLHALLLLIESDVLHWPCLGSLSFSFLFSGNNWKLSVAPPKVIQTPTIHFISPEDFLYQKSLLNVVQFKSPMVIEHSFGHKIPKLGLKETQNIKRFVQKAQQSKAPHARL